MVLDIDDLITLREAAALLKMTYDEVWQLVKRDVLSGYRFSGQWFVSRRQTVDYAPEEHPATGGRPA